MHFVPMSEKAQKSTEQKFAEAEVDRFRKELGPFVVAAEATRMPMVFTNANGKSNPIIFTNDAFLKLTGYSREEVLGQSFNFLSAPVADVVAPEQEVKFDGNSHQSDIRYSRKDGTEFWATVFITPVRNKDGDIVQHFASFVDLTKHKNDDAHSKMLINELNHRVKNTLSTVQSIVWQALRTSDPTTIQEAIESRLLALSRSHDLLTRENWASAELRDILHDALEPFGVAGGRAERIILVGESIRFPPNAALVFGIAFNELATNAVKYGALSNGSGSLNIQWKKVTTLKGKQLLLQWLEKDGPPVKPPSRKGFGSRVIEHGLAHELDGTVNLDYQPDGLVCTMTIPIVEGGRNE